MARLEQFQMDHLTVMQKPEILGPEFEKLAAEAGDQARRTALEHGVSVFYLDDSGIETMECPDGRKFEIRYIPGMPRDRNYEIVRELAASPEVG